MRTGAHFSVRRGFAAALREAAHLGCETLQLFTQSPHDWLERTYTEEEFLEFRRERERLGLDPVVTHAPYLPNLASSNEEMRRKSYEALVGDLRRTEQLGADYLVIHPGAYSPGATFETGLAHLSAGLNEALKAVPGRAVVLIENMAGGGRRIGGPFHEIASILSRVENQGRIGVCFDTCHAVGAGYDLSGGAAVSAVLREFDRDIGLERIRVFHCNDSRGARGSHRDLHEHIGRGHIGEPGFRALFATPAFADRPLILETPKDPMPQADLENLARLRACLPPRQRAA